MNAFAKAREKYDTSVVLPQMIAAYEAAGEVYYGETGSKARRSRSNTGKSTCPCHPEPAKRVSRDAPELATVG
jgi:hypothetical protein